jgi:hypothetical protein
MCNHVFLTSDIERNQLLASGFGRLTLGKEPYHSMNRKFSEVQRESGCCEEEKCLSAVNRTSSTVSHLAMINVFVCLFVCP